MQFNWAIAGIPFLVTIDKIIISPILGSCRVCLPFMAASSPRLCCCVCAGRRRCAGESVHSRHSSSPLLRIPNKMSSVADWNKAFSYPNEKTGAWVLGCKSLRCHHCWKQAGGELWIKLVKDWKSRGRRKEPQPQREDEEPRQTLPRLLHELPKCKPGPRNHKRHFLLRFMV